MTSQIRHRQVRGLGRAHPRVWRIWGPARLGMLALAFANGTARGRVRALLPIATLVMPALVRTLQARRPATR